MGPLDRPVRVDIDSAGGFVSPQALRAARQGATVEVISGFVCGFPDPLAPTHEPVPEGRYTLTLHRERSLCRPLPFPCWGCARVEKYPHKHIEPIDCF